MSRFLVFSISDDDKDNRGIDDLVSAEADIHTAKDVANALLKGGTADYVQIFDIVCCTYLERAPHTKWGGFQRTKATKGSRFLKPAPQPDDAINLINAYDRDMRWGD